MERQEECEKAIQQTLGGHVNAFGVIIELYEMDVVAVVTAMQRTKSDIEDLVQVVFMKAYTHLADFESGRRFDYWIKAIARNVVKDDFAKKASYSKHLELYKEHILVRYSLEDEINTSEEKRLSALKQCREALQESVQEALEMKYGHGMKIESIATKLGRTLAATKKMLSRSRISLRACVESKTGISQ